MNESNSSPSKGLDLKKIQEKFDKLFAETTPEDFDQWLKLKHAVTEEDDRPFFSSTASPSPVEDSDTIKHLQDGFNELVIEKGELEDRVKELEQRIALKEQHHQFAGKLIQRLSQKKQFLLEAFRELREGVFDNTKCMMEYIGEVLNDVDSLEVSDTTVSEQNSGDGSIKSDKQIISEDWKEGFRKFLVREFAWLAIPDTNYFAKQIIDYIEKNPPISYSRERVKEIFNAGLNSVYGNQVRTFNEWAETEEGKRLLNQQHP